MKPVIYLSYGMQLLFFINLSTGMDTLRNKLRAAGFDARGPYYYGEFDRIIADIAKLPPEQPVGLIGHSYGGNYATYIAHAVYPRKVAYLGTYDPTTFSTRFGNVTWPLRENVEYAQNFRGLNRSIGGARLELANHNLTTRLLDVPTRVRHGAVDDHVPFHTMTLEALGVK